ncbi:AraC family transcriptional regulator [Sulfuricystis multivorans]|uniref:AraC family transcriptional regulator n=1 Tax=Sulfuricystis multivorans TaxID=2211108 RepID=UPI000F845E27|nr:AraC family transcriptional regulator [Sulfuricystis multivorans]
MDASDGLSRLLDHTGLRARTFYTGALCGLHAFHAAEGVGHLHVVRAGTVRIMGAQRMVIEGPALLFYPRPLDHRLDVPSGVTAEVLCASVSYDAGMDNALVRALPALVVVPLDGAPGLAPTLELLFTQARMEGIGRQAMLDRLCDVVLIQIVRHAIERGWIARGLLTGLAHPRLGKTLTAMLDAPGEAWTLETMAARANLSRSSFARHFRETVGATPAALLAQVRIGLAQRLLRQGKPLATVAQTVGYGSQPALSRAFIRETGIAPSDWLRQQITK